jgi:hypothetical protein
VAIKLLDQLATKVGPLLANIVNPGPVGLSLILTGMVIILFLIFEPRDSHLGPGKYYSLWRFNTETFSFVCC